MAVRSRRAARAEIEPEFEIVEDAPIVVVPVKDLDAPVAFNVVDESAPRGPMPLPPILREGRQAAPPPPPPVPTEWARRQVGPAPAGRTKGACSGCGAMLSVTNQRPLRIACPVCGRTRLLA
jgi:hypothetical protein